MAPPPLPNLAFGRVKGEGEIMNGKFFTMSTAKIEQSGKPPPSPARHGRQAAPGADVEGIRPFQGASVNRPLREQLNEQLKRRLKEYYAERQRLSPRP